MRERQAALIRELYAALETPNGVVLSSLTPAADLKFCRERINDPLHPRLGALSAQRNVAAPDEIFLIRNDNVKDHGA